MKTLWKLAAYVAIVLLSFSMYSCGDDDEDAVGSRELLLGTWNGVYYLSQEWEDGEMVDDSKEDFVNGTNRESIEFKEDGTFIEKDTYPAGTSYYHGEWSYSGNKLTLSYTELENEHNDETYVYTVTKMTENELVFELREKEKEDGTTYEYYEQYFYTR